MRSHNKSWGSVPANRDWVTTRPPRIKASSIVFAHELLLNSPSVIMLSSSICICEPLSKQEVTTGPWWMRGTQWKRSVVPFKLKIHCRDLAWKTTAGDGEYLPSGQRNNHSQHKIKCDGSVRPMPTLPSCGVGFSNSRHPKKKYHTWTLWRLRSRKTSTWENEN